MQIIFNLMDLVIFMLVPSFFLYFFGEYIVKNEGKSKNLILICLFLLIGIIAVGVFELLKYMSD